MARTLVGILQILLRQDVTQKAPAINQALRSIERQATQLGKAPWGAGFQRQLEKLKVSPAERAAIVASYDRLARDINGKISRADLSAWRTGVLGHLAAVRTEMTATAAEARRMQKVLRSTLAGGLIGGLVSYGAYAGTRGGVGAAFEKQRQEANAYFAGLPEEDRARIKARSEELSAKYGIFSADMFEVLKEASLSMPSTDLALEAGDTMARLFVTLEAMFGREGALSGLYDLNKMADNAELNLSAEQYQRVMEMYLRAQQVLGKDLSPGDMKRAVQYARIAGKTLSEEFLMTWLPIIAAETSGSDAGTQIRANFDQLIAGRASEKAKKRMNELGIMQDGELVGMDLYGENPVLWANEILLPALKAGGVDTDNMMELGKAIGELTQNRQSSDLLARALIAIEQYKRYAEERFPQAKGLAAADEIRQLDPFAATTGMINSLKNLSAALGEHVVPVIVPAMNSFASSVETVAAAVRGAEGWQVGLGAIATAAGVFGAFKVGSAALGGMIALTTAGPSLQTAAMMLQGAATSLGGGRPGGLPPGPGAPAGHPGSKIDPSLLLLMPWLADWIGTNVFDRIAGEGATAESRTVTDGALERTLQRIFGPTPEPTGSPYDHLRAGGVQSSLNADITAAADEAGTALYGLNTTVSPSVDTADIERAIALVERLVTALRSVGGITGRQAAAVRQSVNGLYADYGVAP